MLGVGDLRTGPPVIGSLANFFGERSLEVRLWDPSREVLDIMDRFARECFKWNGAEHHLVALNDLDECVESVDGLIICANAGASVASITEARLEDIPRMDLAQEYAYWLPEVGESELTRRRFEILRMIKREEYPFELVNDYKQSPVIEWLNAFL